MTVGPASRRSINLATGETPVPPYFFSHRLLVLRNLGMAESIKPAAGDPFSQIHDVEAPQEEVRNPAIGVEPLVQQIKETADKLIRDHANRGDVKLLSTAVKELRYCFKIFAAYRNRRKVTVFGSARLP